MLELTNQLANTCANVGPGNFWVDSCFWRAFFTSPGFGALAAVLAALGVWINTTADRRRAREEDRSEKWWAATMWAADHSFSDKDDEVEAGFNALDALQNEAWEFSDPEMAFIETLARDPVDEFSDFEEGLLEGDRTSTMGNAEEAKDEV
jgi:hypothetical protein